MRHASSRALYDYWNRLRGLAVAPDRRAVEPRMLREVLGDAFILDGSDGSFPFRLAGTRICSAYGREMRDRSFLDAFSAPDRTRLLPALTALVSRGTPFTFTFRAWTARSFETTFDGLMLPLRHDGPKYDRVLGVMAPIAKSAWLGMTPIVDQDLTSLRPVAERPSMGGPETVAPSLVARSSRLKSGFVLLEGGKS